MVAVIFWLPGWLDKSQPTSQSPAVLGRCRLQPMTEAVTSEFETVNKQALIAHSGAPLPSPTPEDLEVHLAASSPTNGSSNSFLLYDNDAGNWETLLVGDNQLRVCFVDNQLFLENDLSQTWDEVRPEDLELETDVWQYILSEEQLSLFNQQAVQLDDELCGNYSCAVWQAELAETFGLITIRVNQFNRKIFDVSIFDDADIIIASYFYRSVVVELPEAVRYLPQDQSDLEPATSSEDNDSQDH